MKKCSLLLLFLWLGIASAVWAQDRGISYQAVARDADDAVIAQQNLVVRFTLLQGGTSVYQEAQTVATNQFGLFSAVIGSEDFTAFNAIDWVPATSLQVEIDPGTGFVDMGTTALEAVPYAKTATQMSLGELTDVSISVPSNDQVLTWDGSQWVPADPPPASPWTQNGTDIFYDQGNVGIGTATPGIPFSVLTDGVSSRKVKIETDSIRSSNDMIEMVMPGDGPDGAQFIEFQRGTVTEARINGDGSAEFNAITFGDGTTQESAATGPIAFGYIDSNGSVAASSGNVTATYNAGSSRYEITIVGENYFFNQYVTLVTPGGSAIVGDYRVSSSGGNMLVYLRNNAGNDIQGDFMFVTFKP